MIRDTQSFRERFNRWKNGESYWDIVGKPLNVQSQPRQEDTQNYPIDDFDQYIYSTSNPIGYNDGKDNALAYTNDYDDVLGLDSQKDQKVINMYDSVIVNGQRQTPTPNNPIVGYDGGKDIPEYGHGKNKSRVYSEEQLRKSLMNYGVTDPYMVAGIMGNAKIESGYNPDSVSKSGTYKGLWQLQPGYVQYVTDNYGNYDPESQIRFIADIVKGTLPETKSTTGKWLSIGVSKKLRQIKNTRPEQAAYNFQKYFEGAMGQNNSGRMNAARDVYDSYLFDKNKLTVDKIISQSQAVPVDVTRVQKPLVTYNPNTPTTYSNPAYAQKPVENIPTDIQRPKSILPNIIDTYNNLQNDQQPLIIQPKRSFIQPQWQNGKDSQQVDMSKVGMGAEKKPNYFIDNTMNPLPEVTITGDALKNNNRMYKSSFDRSINPYLDMFNATIGQPMNVLSPAQQFGAITDIAKGKKTYAQSIFGGNSGFVTDNYQHNHPIISAGTNLLGDIVIPYTGVKIAKYTNNLLDLRALNNFNKKYNYTAINPKKSIIFNDNKLDQVFDYTVNRHNTFVRGVDPYETQKFGRLTDKTPEEAAKYSLTHIPKTYEGNNAGLALNEDGLYVSNDFGTAAGYTNGNGYIGIVRRPIQYGQKTRRGFLADNDFIFTKPKGSARKFYSTTDEPAPKNNLQRDYPIDWSKNGQKFEVRANAGATIIKSKKQKLNPDFRHYVIIGKEGEEPLDLIDMRKMKNIGHKGHYGQGAVGLSRKK